MASYGRASCETEYNGGMGSNGLTSARHDVFHKTLANKYPESFDSAVPEHLVYSGKYALTDVEPETGVTVGKLVLSPTRTYAPVVKRLLDTMERSSIHGMVHCSGGAQSKVAHFLNDGLHVVKDNMLPVPPLFRLIRECSDTDWAEMYKVFNCGHRMEVYCAEADAAAVIAASEPSESTRRSWGGSRRARGKARSRSRASTGSSRTTRREAWRTAVVAKTCRNSMSPTKHYRVRENVPRRPCPARTFEVVGNSGGVGARRQRRPVKGKHSSAAMVGLRAKASAFEHPKAPHLDVLRARHFTAAMQMVFPAPSGAPETGAALTDVSGALRDACGASTSGTDGGARGFYVAHMALADLLDEGFLATHVKADGARCAARRGRPHRPRRRRRGDPERPDAPLAHARAPAGGSGSRA